VGKSESNHNQWEYGDLMADFRASAVFRASATQPIGEKLPSTGLPEIGVG